MGDLGEQRVAKEYKQRGYQVIDKNFFNRFGKQIGEIDLIALQGATVVFVEVKTRTSDKFGTPAEAVDRNKQEKILKACKYFQTQNPQFAQFNFRIDVAEVFADLDKSIKSVNIIENAVMDNT